MAFKRGDPRYEARALEIKELRDQGITHREIAERYGLKTSRIGQIILQVERNESNGYYGEEKRKHHKYLKEKKFLFDNEEKYPTLCAEVKMQNKRYRSMWYMLSDEAYEEYKKFEPEMRRVLHGNDKPLSWDAAYQDNI